MKKLLLGLVVTAVGLASLAGISASPASAAATNLIQNPSLEVANGAVPASWSTAGWGTNTARFTYDTGSAVDGSRAVTTTISAYTSGAAEWVAAPVAVSAGAYTFSDYYRSSVPTEVGGTVTYANGTTSYLYIGTLPATPAVVPPPSNLPQDAYSWKQSSLLVTVPANAVSLSVFQVLYSVGLVQTDNYSLVAGVPGPPPPPPIGTELISNPSGDTGSATAPTGWSMDGWGTNTANFSWPTTNTHSGSHSLSVTVSNWQDGDAKWDYTAVPVVSGQYYTFSDWYKATTTTSVSLGYTLADGSFAWANLRVGITPETNWTQLKVGVIMPYGATTAFFTHFLPGNGTLQTDDYSMKPAVAPVGFARPVVSLTFDNGTPTQVTGIQQANALGFKATAYDSTNLPRNEPRWAPSDIQNLYRAGNEIASHTVKHVDLTTLTSREVKNELDNSKTYLENLVGRGNVTDFATPLGAYNDAVIAAVKAAGYSSHRSVDVGYNGATDLNQWNIRVQNVYRTTTMPEFQSWIDRAIAGHYYLVIVYHEIYTDAQNVADPSPNSTTPAEYTQMLNYIKTSGVTVEPVNTALKELLPQVHS